MGYGLITQQLGLHTNHYVILKLSALEQTGDKLIYHIWPANS